MQQGFQWYYQLNAFEYIVNNTSEHVEHICIAPDLLNCNRKIKIQLVFKRVLFFLLIGLLSVATRVYQWVEKIHNTHDLSNVIINEKSILPQFPWSKYEGNG